MWVFVRICWGMYYIIYVRIYVYMYIATVDVSYWINGQRFVMMHQITRVARYVTANVYVCMCVHLCWCVCASVSV